ncbi:hypothetical protein GCM10010252_64740 [Streptomyces aureoverticillatus]|nr:hypothetical protein GCM10010252_64740 [Streptomyces aureoverticillatus]
MKPAIPCYYRLDVEITPERIEQVRRILAAHLRHWGLGMLVEHVCHCTRVLLCAIEEHGTDKKTSVEMWWNGQHLITAVSDNDRDLPPRHYEPEGCLAQIAALSDGWGSCPATDGKIIWFSCRARATEYARLVPPTPAPSLREAKQVPREKAAATLAAWTDTAPLAATADTAGLAASTDTAAR